jgi:hypothetical protein
LFAQKGGIFCYPDGMTTRYAIPGINRSEEYFYGFEVVEEELVIELVHIILFYDISLLVIGGSKPQRVEVGPLDSVLAARSFNGF